MKNYRTTIVLPTEVYKKSRMRAASENKSLSRFIAELLCGHVGGAITELPRLPLGKYKLKGPARITRQDIYEPYLRRKVPS